MRSEVIFFQNFHESPVGVNLKKRQTLVMLDNYGLEELDKLSFISIVVFYNSPQLREPRTKNTVCKSFFILLFFSIVRRVHCIEQSEGCLNSNRNS